MRVLAFGEILWDIIDGKEHLGGAPFNFAAHAVQCGDEAYIISRLGDDSLGRGALDQCKQHNVRPDFIQTDSTHATGTVYVELKDGQPDYTITKDVAYDFIEYNKTLETLTPGFFDIFYFGSLAQRNSTSANTLHEILKNINFSEIFYDVNLRKGGYTKEIVISSLAFTTIFKLNHEEVPVLSQLMFDQQLTPVEFCQKLAVRFQSLRLIVITAADKGCFIFQYGKMTHTPCAPVKVADAVGAGDAFSAAFMHTFYTTSDGAKAATVANSVGGFVASMNGAIPRYSSEIQKMIPGSL